MVNNPATNVEDTVRPQGWEDPLEEMAIHFSILAWRIPWIEEPGASMGSQKSCSRLGDSTTTTTQPFRSKSTGKYFV